jgi:DNA-binding response OmpR family regulator
MMRELDSQPSLVTPLEIRSGIDLDAQHQLSQKRILVVDDDPAGVSHLKHTFMGYGYNVSGATSPQEVLKKINLIHPSLVILEIMIPDTDGEQLLRDIRAEMNVPIIIISTVAEKSTIIRMLQVGVDDYITKPYDEAVLLARVQAVLRRAERHLPENVFAFPDIELSIDLDTYEVRFHNDRVHLTGKMFDVLALLARSAPRVVNYQELTMKVWGENTPAVRNRLKYLVYLLRKQFFEINPGVEVFENIDRLGYRLCTNGTERVT